MSIRIISIHLNSLGSQGSLDDLIDQFNQISVQCSASVNHGTTGPDIYTGFRIRKSFSPPQYIALRSVDN